jgi:hypothetical protein
MSIQTAATQSRQSAREGMRRLGGDIERLDVRTRALTKDHPLLVLSGALFFGYVCGRLAARI